MSGHKYSIEALPREDDVIVKCSCGWKAPVTRWRNGGYLWKESRRLFALHLSHMAKRELFADAILGLQPGVQHSELLVAELGLGRWVGDQRDKWEWNPEVVRKMREDDLLWIYTFLKESE